MCVDARSSVALPLWSRASELWVCTGRWQTGGVVRCAVTNTLALGSGEARHAAVGKEDLKAELFCLV